MTYGFWSRLAQVGLVGVVTFMVGFAGCGRERANPIDPSFQGTEAKARQPVSLQLVILGKFG